MFSNLLPDPLHPAMVHLPIALAVLLPVVALGGAIALRKGIPVRWAWGTVVALLAALSVSSFVAKQTGETDEEVVEEVVVEATLEAHEEAADRFMVLTLVVLVAGVSGLASGAIGRIGQVATLLGSALLLVAGWQVGHLGGQLAYRDGAAAAHATGLPASGPTNGVREDDDD